MNPLAQALELLAGAVTPADRAAALALVVAPVALDEASPEDRQLSHLIAHRHHLILRGGATTLLREALSEPEGSPLRRAAEAHAAALPASPGERTVQAVRRGGTRPREDGRVRTLETGGSNAGGVAFSADGAFLYTFVWGSPPWLEDDEPSWSARFLQWRTDTGELVRQGQVGQFREENGSFAVSPDGRTLAVRRHREIAIHDLHAWHAGPRPPLRHMLFGTEGPYTITFLDDTHLVADDSSYELVLWNAVTGQRVSTSHAVGWHGHVVSRRSPRLFLGGCIMTPGRMIGTHALPSLEMDGCFVHGGGPESVRIRSEVIALSPSEQLLATGDTTGAIHLWRTEELRDPERRSSPRQPLPVAARLLGQHAHPLTAACFVDETRLLTGDRGGVLLDWRLDDVGAALGPPRQLIAHRDAITALAVHPRRHLAATSSEDGRVLLWDLRGEGTSPPRPLLPMRRDRRCHPHPEGVEVITDDQPQLIPWPSQQYAAAAAAAGPIVPQDPELCGINVGELALVPVDDPGPPQLRLLRGDEVLDVLELEAHCASLCPLGARSFALVEEGHVSFWELWP